MLTEEQLKVEGIRTRWEQMPQQYRKTYEESLKSRRPRAAIEAFCLECIGWEKKEVTKCTDPGCPLYRLRPFQVDGPSTP